MVRATIQDVARHVGVSKQVVSAVLGKTAGTVRASAATRRKIEVAARALNYSPDILARAFTAKRSFLVGLAALELDALHLASLVNAAQKVLAPHDYSLVVDIYHDAATQQAAIERLLHRRVEGLIITPFRKPDGKVNAALFGKLRKAGVPMVEIFSHALRDVPKVNADHMGIGRQQTRHLIGLGHRRIALLTHDHYADPARDARDHFEGYAAAMGESGLSPLVVARPMPVENRAEELQQNLLEEGWRAAAGLRDHPQRPSAVVCYSSYMAAGLLQACAGIGIRVPTDLSVISSTHSPMAFPVLPVLTAVLHPTREIGERATTMLYEMIHHRPVESALVTGTLVAGGSTAPLRAGRSAKSK